MNKIVLSITALMLTAILAAPAAYARGPYQFNKSNTPGWSLMTPEERTENRDRMRSAKTYAECKSYQDEHHKLMEVRAKEKGITLPMPSNNACDQMKARGYLK